MKKSLVFFIFIFVAISTNCMAQSYMENNTTEPLPKIKVFPNPATDVVNILGLQNVSQASIHISDIYGNTILFYQWEIKNNALNIPIADLEKGIYMISIESLEQQVATKFIKQ